MTNTNATNKRIHELITDLDEGRLISRPEFQRRLVWKNEDKLNFLDTVLKGYPFPEIYLAAGEVDLETGKSTTLLVDGQQRLTTLHQYFKDSDEIIFGNFVRYISLSKEEKTKFLEYIVVIRDLGRLEQAELREVFKRINSTNYNLNSFEVHNAIYNGEYKKLGEELSEDSFFMDKGIFNVNDIKRMRDVQYILILITTVLSNYFSAESSLEEYLSIYNENFLDKELIKQRFKNTLNIVNSMNFSNNSRVWNKADFFSLFIEVYWHLYKFNLKIDIAEIALLRGFFSEVESYSKNRNEDASESVKNYYLDVLQGSNNRDRRIRRGDTIRSVLNSSS